MSVTDVLKPKSSDDLYKDFSAMKTMDFVFLVKGLIRNKKIKRISDLNTKIPFKKRLAYILIAKNLIYYYWIFWAFYDNRIFRR